MSLSAAAGRAPAPGQPEPPRREERAVKSTCFGVLLILIITAATMLSGCSSAPAPTTGVTGTPIATVPGPTPEALMSGALFDTGRLQWFAYRLTTAGSDKPAVSGVRFDYTTTAINGMTLRDDRITMKLAAPDMLVIMDRYYDPASNARVGSRVKTESTGASLSDLGLQAGDLYRIGNIVDACTAGSWPLKSLGTEAVTIDGNSYSCTKYAIGISGEHGTAWASGNMPVPVKIETVSDSGAITTWELIGRG